MLHNELHSVLSYERQTSAMDPSSGLFGTSVGLFVNKEPVEARQLRESDFLREIDQVQLQLNQLARSYLLSSITFYREGVRHLFKLKSSSNGGETENAGKQIEVFTGSPTNPISNVCPTLKDLRLRDLDDVEKRALLAAKKEFEKARSEAIRAFNNEGLPIFDRIQAMVIRVAATMLENVDHPEDALGVCIGCLEDLHGLHEIQENFSLEICRGYKHPFYKEFRRQIISSVCRINHFVRNAAVMIAKKGELLTFPLIDIEGGKIDPLHDHRVAEALTKQDIPHYVIPPLALGEKEEIRPKIPQGIAVSLQDHCIVGDEWDCSVKAFDVSGSFLGHILVGDKKSVTSIIDVATDGQNNVYILLRQDETAETVRFKMCVRDMEGNKKKEFLLEEKNTEVLRMTVKDNGEIFVLTAENPEISGSAVDVFDSGGEFVRSFGKDKLHCPQDICAINNGQVIVLDKDDQCVLSVQLFSSNLECIDDDLLKSVREAKTSITKLRPSIACHRSSNVVVLALPSETDQDPVRILKYDMSDGKLLPSVDIPVTGQVSTRGVAVTTQGRIAIGLLDKDKGDSKVLII